MLNLYELARKQPLMLGTFCMEHRSRCLCWPKKLLGVAKSWASHSGLLLLVCWYKSAVQVSQDASTRGFTLFLKICENEGSCMLTLRTGGGEEAG